MNLPERVCVHPAQVQHGVQRQVVGQEVGPAEQQDAEPGCRSRTAAPPVRALDRAVARPRRQLHRVPAWPRPPWPLQPRRPASSLRTLLQRRGLQQPPQPPGTPCVPCSGPRPGPPATSHARLRQPVGPAPGAGCGELLRRWTCCTSRPSPPAAPYAVEGALPLRRRGLVQQAHQPVRHAARVQRRRDGRRHAPPVHLPECPGSRMPASSSSYSCSPHALLSFHRRAASPVLRPSCSPCSCGIAFLRAPDCGAWLRMNPSASWSRPSAAGPASPRTSSRRQPLRLHGPAVLLAVPGDAQASARPGMPRMPQDRPTGCVRPAWPERCPACPALLRSAMRSIVAPGSIGHQARSVVVGRRLAAGLRATSCARPGVYGTVP